MDLIQIPVSEIRLDPENPRLPEYVDRESESEVLRFLYRTAVLDEIATSLADNGYFEHEPLLVAREEDGRYEWVVLEGNRRLAALKVLLQTAEAAEAGLQFDIELTQEQREDLERVPCYVISGREEVRKYLGFRHIGGIKTWGPEAKARYVYDEVERAAEAGDDRPFVAVARRVGSNTQGIRNSYVALAVLRWGRVEFGIATDFVQYERFGVWQRTISAPKLRAYIGYGDPSTYEEVNEALQNINGDSLREVFGDLSAQPGQSRPVLADSRDATAYAKVLQNERAHEVLRKYNDLSLAKQVIEQAELPLRIGRLRDGAALLRDEIERLDEVDPAVTSAVTELARIVRAMQQLSRPVDN